MRAAIPYIVVVALLGMMIWAVSFGTLPPADFTFCNGDEIKTEVPYRQADVQGFYDNLVAAIERGEPLAVSAESAARNINVLCAAERSHERGGVPVGLSP